MTPSWTIKNVQCLIKRIKVLSRFLSRSTEKSLLFFKELKQLKNFQWMFECQATFDELKRYVRSPPLFSKPKLDKVLYLYLAVSELALRLMLVRKEGTLQKLIYYINQILHDIKTRYAMFEKVVSMLLIST